jgi:hypothetical protein
MKWIYSLLSVVALGLGWPCLAQTTGSDPPKARAAKVNELERGLFFGVTAGPSFLLNPPALTGGKRPFVSGQMLELDIGVDLGERVSLSAFLMGSQYRAGSDYLGQANGPLSGDFSGLIPGGSLRLNLFGFADDQGTARTWIYLRGGAGYEMFFPKALLPNADVLTFAGPGLEYYTHLRHFSIGLEVAGSYLVKSGALGFWVAPNVRYAF